MKIFWSILGFLEFLFAILGFYFVITVLVAIYQDRACVTINSTTYGACPIGHNPITDIKEK